MANYDSSSVKRLGFPRGPGPYVIKDVGTITVASNVTLGSGAPDLLRVCYIPPNAYLSNFMFAFPAGLDGGNTLTMKLIDSLTTTTTYIAALTTTICGATGGMLQMGVVANGIAISDGAKWGTMYGATVRAIGSTGAPVAVWSSGAILQFSVVTSATNTTGATALNITYMVEWSPMTDGGV